MRKIILIISFYLFFNNLHSIELKGEFYQGNLIIGKTEPGSKIYIDKKNIKISKEGYFAFGLSKDRQNDVIIRVVNQNKIEEIVKKVYKKKYKIQKIDGLPQKQVTPPKEVYERIKNENKLISEARSINSDYIYFVDKFNLPIENSIITGVYGSQRILNGIPKSPHYGLDFSAKEGTPIKAMLDGVVTLSEKDMYYTGGTIIFDHGHGVNTLYMHLKDINVLKGQKVKKGDIIGSVGKTGRSTGAHLDIRLNIFDMKLDPESVLNLK
jgi:murein DD-endopeptidase MepM/ murein hydrolase activator NlpD